MTNGDKVRAMTDEELAEVMMCPDDAGITDICCKHDDDCNCYECCLKWLKED